MQLSQHMHRSDIASNIIIVFRVIHLTIPNMQTSITDGHCANFTTLDNAQYISITTSICCHQLTYAPSAIIK